MGSRQGAVAPGYELRVAGYRLHRSVFLAFQSSIPRIAGSIFNNQSRGGGKQMALMRGFSKVDDEGKVPIPNNIRREVGLKEGQIVEIKVSGPNRAQFVTIHKRQSAR